MSQLKKYYSLEKQIKIMPQRYKAAVNLRVYAGVAKPSPKMGQALGPLGINMMQFCKSFNEKTSHIRQDVPLKVQVLANHDRTFNFLIKPPETSWLLKKALGVEKFTNYPGHLQSDFISLQEIYEIAKIKLELDPHFYNVPLQSVVKQIIDQTKSMGVAVTTDYSKPQNIIKPPVKV